MAHTRAQIFDIIEKDSHNSITSKMYDVFMLVVIVLSIIPLMFTVELPWFKAVDKITTVIFIVDYVLRWITADMKLNRKEWSFVLYPFTPMAIIDIISILPGLNILNPAFKIFRLSRVLRVFRLLKLLRYTNKVALFLNVIKKEKNVLLTVLVIAVFYIFLTALIMFNAEPRINPETGVETFSSFFDALYWATVTLTTVGYGDLCPVTDLGRFISMLSSLFGVAIIALPSGVITASYLDELRALKESKNKTEEKTNE